MPKMTGIDYYNKAKRLIPGGTQLLSKRPEMFLPDQWPAYYQKCQGVDVWDLEGRHLIDMSIMGVGACILGYCDSDVDAAVIRAVASGNMCTLNSPEEVKLAELMCELHPWAQMVRYCRCGGEAMAIAVRIVRAAAGKSKIAFCGYHGWHDWYLAANLANKDNLAGQLLPGLDPWGVPPELSGTTIPFNYNDVGDFDRVVSEHGDSLAAIVMEPVRYTEPQKGFLKHIRESADKIGVALIFDEVTTGWRMTNGGIHLQYEIEPDVAVFAKGTSNGYPMAVIIGKKPVMEAAQKSFISSTYWTDKIGPTAALATIKKFVDLNVREHLIGIGEKIREGWRQCAEKQGLDITIKGIPPLSVFNLNFRDQSQVAHTYFTQIMLEKGYLASKAFYASYAHTEKHVAAYMESVEDAFFKLKSAADQGDIESRLKGPVAHSGFKRLN